MLRQSYRDSSVMNRVRYQLALMGVGLAILASGSTQQQARAYLEAVPSGETIKVRWLTGELPQGGFILERRTAGSGEFQPLPNMPLQPNWSQQQWESTFGAFFPLALITVGVEQTPQFFQRLQTQSVSRIGLGLVSLDACRLMGWYYEDKGVESGTRYDYRLVTAGQRQVLATVEGVTAGAPPALPAPPKPTVKLENQQVTIQWTFPNDPKLHGVLVERAVSAEGPYELVRPFISVNGFWLRSLERNPQARQVSGDTVVLDVAPQQNRVYFYRLVAVDFVGNRGATSEPVAFQVPFLEPPAPPANVTAEVDPNGRVILRWEASPSEQTVGYLVYRGTNLGDEANEKLTAQPLPKEARQYTVERQEAGTVLWYAVVSVDPFDAESQRTAGVQVKIPDATAPQPPKGLKIELVSETPAQAEAPAPRKLVLTWDANTENDLLGYHVQRGTLQEGPFLTLTNEPLRETRYEIPLLAEEEGDLFFRLQAIDYDQNLSLPAPSVKVSLPNVQPPDPPAIVQVVAEGNLNLVIAWNPSVAPDLDGYTLERRVEGGEWEVIQQRLPKTNTRYTDSGLTGGRTYEYRITAVDTGGLKSIPSEPMGGIPRDTEPPQPPPSLSVRYEPGAGGVLVVWEPSPSKDVAKYLLYRAEGDKGEFVPVSGDISPDQTRILDVGVALSSSYHYQIIAVDFAGNLSQPTTSRSLKLTQ